MSKVLPTAQFSFNTGTFSPRLFGRTDIENYKSAVEIADNVICLPHGPFIKRNGSRYITTVGDTSGDVRLIKFQKAVGDSFILEFGDNYARVIKGDTTRDYVEITSGTTDGTTADHLIDSTNTFSTTSVGDRVFNRTDRTSAKVTAVASGDLTLDSDIFVSGEDYYITPEINTTLSGSDVFDFEYAQFGDDLYFVIGNGPPSRLHRTNDFTWVAEVLDFTPGATFEGGEFPDTTLTPAATTGAGVAFTAGAASFLANDIGRQIIYRNANTDELLGKGIIVTYTSTTIVGVDITFDFPSTSAIASGDWKIDLSPNTALNTISTKTIGATCTLTSLSNTWKDNAQITHVGRYAHVHNGIVRIDAVASALSCSGEVVKQLDATTATDVWTLQEEAWTATHGYPKSVGFFEERMWLGGNDNQPQNLWASASNDFTNFGVGADDADALDLLISDSIASPISWISSGRDLIIGGTGGEFTIGSSGGFITPSDRSIRLRSTHGSSVQIPQRIDNETLFVDAAGTRIRSVRYDFDSDNYIADDLLYFGDHLTKSTRNPGIKQIAVAQSPNNLIYAVLNNGDMLVGQFNRQQQIIGWERFQTKGDYKSVATIANNDQDEVWVVVERLINGTETQYIERFDEFDTANGEDPEDGFLDSFGIFGTAISVTSMTQADPVVVSIPSGHGLVDDDKIIFYDCLYKDTGGTLQEMTDVNCKTFTVANAGATTIELSGIDGTAFELYNSGGSLYKKVTALTGLHHLEGETIQIKADNGAAADVTVTSGNATLAKAAGVIQYGLEYTMTVKTLKLPDSAQISVAGRQVRHLAPILRLYKSSLPTLNGQLLPARSGKMLMNVAPNLFTGDAEYSKTDVETNGQLTITDTSPFPIMCNAIFGNVEIGDL